VLKARIESGGLELVPVVFNAMSALMAERSGFGCAYVGGASLGYLRGSTEAALTALDFAAVGAEIRAATPLPLIADAGVGWGDPVHMHRFVPLLEAAGYEAIELEDQVVPKRVHHHVGVEHMVPAEEMAAKVREAVAARRSERTIIIARTNALPGDADDALRRCDVYAEAGADMLFPVCGDPEKLRYFGARAPLPLMMMVHPGRSFSSLGLSPDELGSLNFRLVVDAITPFALMFEALASAYDGLRAAPPHDPMLGTLAAANALVGMDRLLDVERRTTEKPGRGESGSRT
jgi:2-methylisocitrate lyase-like PEP mutase family enzyme